MHFGVYCGPADNAFRAAGRHFVCVGCLQRVVLEYALEPRQLDNNAGCVPCPGHNCGQPPWTLEHLGRRHLEKATLLAYGVAIRQRHFDAPLQARRRATEFAAREAAARDARLELAVRVQQLRLLVVERDLTLHCPRCAAAFLDYHGCNALYCGGCGCGFCALCLADCGNDAHAHYRQTHVGDIFNRPAFDAAQRLLRHNRLVAVVRRLAGEEGGAPLQRALVAQLAVADLPALGIDAAAVLREAGVGQAVQLVGAGGLAEAWVCVDCTLANPLALEHCDVCGGARPAAATALLRLAMKAQDVRAAVEQHAEAHVRAVANAADADAAFQLALAAAARERVEAEARERAAAAERAAEAVRERKRAAAAAAAAAVAALDTLDATQLKRALEKMEGLRVARWHGLPGENYEDNLREAEAGVARQRARGVADKRRAARRDAWISVFADGGIDLDDPAPRQLARATPPAIKI